jgi:hypothetical protein
MYFAPQSTEVFGAKTPAVSFSYWWPRRRGWSQMFRMELNPREQIPPRTSIFLGWWCDKAPLLTWARQSTLICSTHTRCSCSVQRTQMSHRSNRWNLKCTSEGNVLLNFLCWSRRHCRGLHGTEAHFGRRGVICMYHWTRYESEAHSLLQITRLSIHEGETTHKRAEHQSWTLHCTDRWWWADSASTITCVLSFTYKKKKKKSSVHLHDNDDNTTH